MARFRHIDPIMGEVTYVAIEHDHPLKSPEGTPPALGLNY